MYSAGATNVLAIILIASAMVASTGLLGEASHVQSCAILGILGSPGLWSERDTKALVMETLLGRGASRVLSSRFAAGQLVLYKVMFENVASCREPEAIPSRSSRDDSKLSKNT